MQCGDINVAATTNGIPKTIAQEWRKSRWWDEWINDIRNQKRMVKIDKLQNIVEKAIAIVDDRLTNGDWYMNKDGELARRHVDVRTAANIAVNILTAQAKIEQDMERNKHNVQVTDKLEQIAMLFEQKIASKTIQEKIKVKDYVDVPVIEENASKGVLEPPEAIVE